MKTNSSSDDNQAPSSVGGFCAILLGFFAVVLAGHWLSGEIREWSAPRLLTIIAGFAFLCIGGMVRHFHLFGDEAAKGSRSALLFATAFLFLGPHLFFWPRHPGELLGKVLGAATFLLALAYLTYRLVRRAKARIT